MTKPNHTRIRKFIALILPLLIIFVFAQEFLFYDYSYDTQRLEQFYKEEQNSLDVIFIGASELTQGYIPGYAYKNYGFTSYLYTVDSNMGSLYLSELKEILKHQNPEILIVDLSGFLIDDDEEFFNNIVMQNYLRGIPFSKNKLQTILQYPSEQTITYFFPLIMYHGHPEIAYRRLLDTYDHFIREEQTSCLKGIVTNTTVYSGISDQGRAFDPLTDNVIAYLTDFLEFCKQNSLNVIFTNFPRKIANQGDYYLLHLLGQAKTIIDQYGYPVLNLQDEIDSIGIDEYQDFADMYHLNIYGQIKMTDYLGKIIMNEYGLSPRTQSNTNQLEWETCASNTQEYIKMALDTIQTGTHILIHETAGCWLYR